MKPEFQYFLRDFFQAFRMYVHDEDSQFPIEYTLRYRVNEEVDFDFRHSFNMFIGFTTDYKKCYIFITNEPGLRDSDEVRELEEELNTSEITVQYLLEKIRSIVAPLDDSNAPPQSIIGSVASSADDSAASPRPRKRGRPRKSSNTMLI